jgi:hypothetical protein
MEMLSEDRTSCLNGPHFDGKTSRYSRVGGVSEA